MAGKKTTSKKASYVLVDKSRGRASRRVAGSALTQSPSYHTDRSGRNGRAQPSADELGRRAWEATYKNRHKN